MKQYINLYDALPKQKKVILPFNVILLVCLVFLIALCVSYFASYWQMRSLSEQVLLLQTHEQSTSAKVLKLAHHLMDVTQDQSLKKQIVSLTQEMKGQKKVVNILEKKQTKAQINPDKVLIVLAEHTAPGAWLTHIIINASARQIELEGYAVSAERALALLRQYNQSAQSSW